MEIWNGKVDMSDSKKFSDHTACILPYGEKSPQIDETAFIAPTASIIGDVIIEAGASVWFGAVLRGDIAPIRIGKNSNIQDGSVIHGDEGSITFVAENVTVGHAAVLHGCTVEKGALIGMGAIVLDGAVVGAGSLVAANALVTSNKQIPANTLWAGSPAKQVKELDQNMQAGLSNGYKEYLIMATNYHSLLA